jgi:plastocyanin
VRPRTRLAVVTAALLGALVALLSPAAHAATTRTVTLTSNGPSPVRLVLAAGDRVRFVNGEQGAQHRVVSQPGWHFDSGTLAPGASSALTPPLPAGGTYRYTDTRTFLIVASTFDGELVMPAARPSPSPTPSRPPSASPTPSAGATPSARPSLTPSATASATPTASPTPSPTASHPGAGSLPPSWSPSPQPAIAYGGPRALVQGSPHRYGMPALLGLVGVAGVGSLLLRLLLTMAPASRRTGDDA